MNDRSDEKTNINNNNNNENIEDMEESGEESDNEDMSSDEGEGSDDFDEEQSDENSSTDEDIGENENQLNTLNGFESEDVSRSNSEPTCYICLNLFSGQEVGSPDSCDLLHFFCLDCIEEWSKQINTCPVDRKRFTYIVVRRDIGSNVIMKLPIVQNIIPEVESVPEDVTYCEICGRCDREDRLLLCDGCDFGYHCECLSPPIETIPIEEWFCPDCYQRLFGPENNSVLAAIPSRRRAIARTGASEVVRQRILERRTQQKRKKTKSKTKKGRKRKTRRKASTKGSKTGRKRKTRRRKKRKTRKSIMASKRLPAADSRTRIASKLGLGPAPKSPFGLPLMKNVALESIRKITDLRAAAGISHLSMFGTELDAYDPRVMAEDDVLDSNGSVGLMARSRIGRFMSSPLKRNLSLPENQFNSTTNGSSIDILSEIMSSQAILHSSSRDVTIGRDGSLHLNRLNSSLPVRSCPNSGPSSPQRTPPSASSSPQRNDSNNNSSNNAFSSSFGGQSRTSANSSYFNEDISSVKPFVNQLTADCDDSKVELYSDIESVGDQNNNKSDSEEEEEGEPDQKLVIDDKDCNSKIDHNINANCGQTSQTSDHTEQTNENMNTNDNKSDTKPTDNNNIINTANSKTKKQIKASDLKRRPSIKDLFGDSDDDEEEDDSDIRQLLAEKGSINVHYPIKMSIVLKNSIKKDGNNGSADKEVIDSEKQLISNESIGRDESLESNKWIAVESGDQLSTSPSKWKSIETNSNDFGVESDQSKWKPIEDIRDNDVINDNNEQEEVDEIEKRVKNLMNEEKSDVMSETNEVIDSKDKSDEEMVAVEEEEGEIREDVMKVRLCRHGRVRREKNRDSKDRRHRSRSSDENKAKKRQTSGNDSNDRDCNEVRAEADDETKEEKLETKDLESVGNENNEKIVWKKSSNTTKMRSYRDGKPKDEELMFREREVPKKLIKKTISNKIKSKESKDSNKSSKDSERHRDWDRARDRKREDGSHGRKHRSEERSVEEKVRHKRKSDELLSSSGVKAKKVKRNDERVDEKRRHSRTRSSDDFNDKEKHRRHHHKRRIKSSSTSSAKKEDLMGRRHRSRKRSHHSIKGSNDEDLKCLMMSGTTSKILRDHSSYADVTPLDSKEIYAEGDRIVINVNFKRDSTKKEEPEEKSGLIIEENQKTISETVGHKTSSKKDDNVYWASPPPVTTTETQTKTTLTTAVARVEDNSIMPSSQNRVSSSQKSPKKSDLAMNENLNNNNNSSNNNSNNISNSSSNNNNNINNNNGNNDGNNNDDNNNNNIMTNNNKKDNKVLDELRFLPRSLHQSEVRPQVLSQSATSFGPHTPEDDYISDQFLPTPTQDESQSPIRSNSVSNSSSSSQLSPDLSPTKEDTDVYDPEAPLQSPVDDQTLLSVTSSQSSNKSIPLRVHLSPKDNIQKPSPKTRPNSSQPINKFSPKHIPKSSPASSNSHSIHSPFKSPSVPTQRQIKSSPVKPLPLKSSPSVMPPPITSSIRPSMSSSIAVTAAAIASLNAQNLAQLLQMAQSLRNPPQQPLQQPRSQSCQQQRLVQNNITRDQTVVNQNTAQNRDLNEVIDMDVESPSPPQISSSNSSSNRVSSTTSSTATANVKTLWDQIIKSTQQSKQNQLTTNKRISSSSTKQDPKKSSKDHLIPSSSTVKHPHHRHQVVSVADNKKQSQTSNKLDQLTVLDDVPSSAVEMQVKEKFIKKLNRQERVIEEVKLVLKPHYQKRTVSKEEYKEILRKSVPKICHSKSGEINPVKIKSLIEGYIKRFKYLRKKSKKLPKH